MASPHLSVVRGWLIGSVAITVGHAVSAQCNAVAEGIAAHYGYVDTVTPLADGGMVIGGAFTPLGNSHGAMHVAVWRDGVWSTLAGGVGGYGAGDGAMSSAVLPNGDIVVGGAFTTAGGQPANNIARWDGAAWHPLGGGVTGGYGYTWIDHMVVMPNGDLVVAGAFYGPVPWLARWDGATWSAIGSGGWEQTQALAVGPTGDLFVAYNELSGSRVMRWDGAAWSQIGAASSPVRVYSLYVTQSGELIAGGRQPSVARWGGSTWLPIGAEFTNTGLATVHALDEFANGDLIAGGHFNQPGSRVARWHGTSWQPIGSGIQQGVTIAIVLDFARLTDGSMALAGLFETVLGVPAGSAAVLSSTCPANATSYGSGCTGSAGPVQLTATQWPMLGGTMRSRTTGVPANALAVAVYAFSQINVPLALAHPLGQPGCDVLVADEILVELLVGGGPVESSINIPIDGNLIGSDFYHQVVPVELDTNGHIQSITSSNGLVLTVGSF